jgi:hypothetical protein
VDFGTAVVTVLAAAVVLLPRVPAIGAPGREQARIKLDVELWAAMPDGASKERLRQEIDRRTAALLEDRGRDRTLEDAWAVGLRWLSVGWVLLVASTAIEGGAVWAGHVQFALQLGGLIAGALGVFLFMLTVALVLWKACVCVWSRLRRRAATVDYEIRPGGGAVKIGSLTS